MMKTLSGGLAVAELPTGLRSGATQPRILIVEDERSLTKVLAYNLQREGYEVTLAHDGQAAVTAAEKFRPAVVLLDISLPKLDGHEVARRIREQPWGKDMVLIALTGWGQDEDRRRSKAAGFDEHMVKPVDYEALMAVLARYDAANATQGKCQPTGYVCSQTS